MWVVAAVGFGILLLIAQRARSPSDDPDPARQRPGFLDEGSLPIAAPRVTPAIPVPGRRAVVFFVRPGELAPLCRALGDSDLRRHAPLAVVVAGPGGPCPGAAVVEGAEPDLTRRFGFPVPRDGGPPVGYAVIDSRGLVRYRTLDPVVADQLDEVATILGAVH